MKILLFCHLYFLVIASSISQNVRRVGKFNEVYAWKQITYDIEGTMVLEDRFADEGIIESGRLKRDTVDDNLYFNDDDGGGNNWNHKPVWQANPIEPTKSPAAINPIDEIGRFFIQYNNVPMGVERVGERLFITIPRRRYGIPATINYIDLNQNTRSPSLSPYPSMRESRSVISVYRTRADECGRLWAVDTGTLEIPNNVTYLQPPAIVVYDLNTNKMMMRYQLKSSDLPAANTPTGLASITIEIRDGDCSDAYAYIPDVVSYGLVVYSLRQNDSWRHSHNYFSFTPTAGNLRVAGQSFQWNDGVFSLALGRPGIDGCRPAYFHAMVSNQEFMVPSCQLQNRVANQTLFKLLGDRGENSQSTMHGLHQPSNVIFFADIGRDAISCWNTDKPLTRNNVEILARDEDKMSYPSDLHVTGDEVWVMVNKLPRFIYSRLDINEYNFFVYRAAVRDLITGTACSSDQSSSIFESSQRRQRSRTGRRNF